MKYVLMENKDKNCIYFIDNSSEFGKKRVQEDINCGCTFLGYLETELPGLKIRAAISRHKSNVIDGLQDMIRNAQKALQY